MKFVACSRSSRRFGGFVLAGVVGFTSNSLMGQSYVPELIVGEYTNEAYNLTNGALTTGTTRVYAYGTFTQSGGTHAVDDQLFLRGAMTERWYVRYATYRMNDGVANVKSMDMGMSYFFQTGGTVRVSGLVEFSGGFGGGVQVNGGAFHCADVLIRSTYALPLCEQRGGVQVVTNTMELLGGGNPSDSHSFRLAGGQLIVSNLVTRRTAFSLEGGTITQSGRLTLDDGTIRAGAGEQQFGTLLLESSGGYSNSTVQFPGTSSVVRFRNSSPIPWSAGTRLNIVNWSGAPAGGGVQRVVFGADNSALTAQQLSQISFVDPAGLPPGQYPARILSSGEVVPLTVIVAGVLIESGQRLPNGEFAVTVRSDAGRQVGIEGSDNLRDWTAVTNSLNTTGTITLVDSSAPGRSRRFYRAVMLP